MDSERRRSAVRRRPPPIEAAIGTLRPRWLVALAVAYFGLSIGVWQLASPEETGAPWWPAAGLTLGMMCRVRRADWPAVAAAVFAADFAADLVQGVPVATALAWSTAKTIEPLLGAIALRRVFAGRLPAFDSPRHVALFFVTAALAGPPVASLIGATTSALTYDQALLATWRTWYIGDIVGILVVAPVVFYSRQLRAMFDLRLGLILALAAAVSLLVFRGVGDSLLLQPYLVGPVLVLAAFTYGAPGAAAAGLVTAVIADVCGALGYGPYALTAANPNALLELQLFTAVELLTVQLLASVLTQMLNAKAHADELTEERLRDPLTGAGNRRRLDIALADATTAADGAAAGTPAAALFLDLDGFKPINDRYGHAAGDEVLRIVAERIERVVRDTDTVARVGGDEFAITCPAIAEADVRMLAKRLSARLGEPMSVHGHTLQVGVSIGHSWVPAATDNPTDLLRRADQAMYRIKSTRGGSDRQAPDGTDVR